METDYNNMKDSIPTLNHTTHYEIGKEVWHKASNNGDIDAPKVLEVQWGECVEEDIERRD